MSPQPTLEIGEGIGTSGQEAYQFDGVRNAVRLPDGRIAIADGGSRQIRIFNGAGHHVLTFGGRGKGPGEFTMLAKIGLVRKAAIGAWDGTLRRMTIFDGKGSVIQTTEVASIRGMEVPAIGWFSDGSVVIAPDASPLELMELKPGRQRITDRYLRVTPSGTIDTIALLAGPEQVVHREGGSFISFEKVLFGHDSYAAVGLHFFYSGDSGTFAIKQRTPAGILKRIIRISATPRPVNQTELDAALDRARERRRKLTEQFDGGIEADAPPARTEHPYFDRLLADETGNLWVRLPDPENKQQRWLVFDRQGTWLGQVETPADLRVTEIGADYVLGVTTSDLDIQRVQIYGLSRPPPR